MVYVVWYMCKEDTIKMEVYYVKTNAINRIGSLIGNYDRCGLYSCKIQDAEVT